MMIRSKRWLLATLIFAAAPPLAFSASARPDFGKTPAKQQYRLPDACIGNTQAVTGTGVTRAQAEQNAISICSRNWAPHYSWSSAQGKAVTCRPAAGGWTCSAHASPCTTIKHRL